VLQVPKGSRFDWRGHIVLANRERNKTVFNFAGLAVNAATAQRYFPIMKNVKVVRFWAGIEGFMPDSIPVIGKGQADNVFHSFGYSAHGYQMGPVCGKIMSELVFDQKTSLPIEPFSVQRFDA
jgi:sarcosine oxidase subunit beta